MYLWKAKKSWNQLLQFALVCFGPAGGLWALLLLSSPASTQAQSQSINENPLEVHPDTGSYRGLIPNIREEWNFDGDALDREFHEIGKRGYVTAADLSLKELKPCTQYIIPSNASLPPHLLRFHLRKVSGFKQGEKDEYLFRIESRLENRLLGFVRCESRDLGTEEVEAFVEHGHTQDLQLGPFWRHLTQSYGEFHFLIPDREFMPDIFPEDRTFFGCSTTTHPPEWSERPPFPEIIIHCSQDSLELCADQKKPCLNLAFDPKINQRVRAALTRGSLASGRTTGQIGIHYLVMIPSETTNYLAGRVWRNFWFPDSPSSGLRQSSNSISQRVSAGYFGHSFYVPVDYKPEGIRIDRKKARTVETKVAGEYKVRLSEEEFYNEIEKALSEDMLQ